MLLYAFDSISGWLYWILSLLQYMYKLIAQPLPLLDLHLFCSVPYHAYAYLRSSLWKSSGATCVHDGKWYFQQVWRENDGGFSRQLQIQLESLPGRNVRQHARRCKLTCHVVINFYSRCRRALQERFAAERDWEKYHTPRNLMLAMVWWLLKPRTVHDAISHAHIFGESRSFVVSLGWWSWRAGGNIVRFHNVVLLRFICCY